MIKAIFFDLDDTLFSESGAWRRGIDSALTVLETKHPEFNQEQLKSTYDTVRRQLYREFPGETARFITWLRFQRITERLNIGLDPELLTDMVDAFWESFLSGTDLFPDAIQTLEALRKKGFKLAVVTDHTVQSQLKKLKFFNLGGKIDFLISSEESGMCKPHPDSFLLAMKKAKVLADEAVMIGDRLDKDVEGANALGMTSVWLKTGEQTPKTDEQIPDYTISALSELIPIIEGFI